MKNFSRIPSAHVTNLWCTPEFSAYVFNGNFTVVFRWMMLMMMMMIEIYEIVTRDEMRSI